jgi:phosphohistidine swiveling domain-containing protein
MSEVLSFSVEGEYITNHFRNLLLEGSWQKALTGLQQSLISQNEDGKVINYPYEDSIRMLMGKEKLIGVDSEIELIKDDKEEEILTSLNEKYNSLIRINDSWYTPYAYVNTCIQGTDLASQRALIYANNPNEDIVLFSFIHDSNYAILCERSFNEPPIWLFDLYSKNTLELAIKSSYSFSQRGLERDQHFDDIIKYQRLDPYEDFVLAEEDFREDLKEEILFKQLKDKIISQAKQKGGFIEVKLEDNRTFMVPKAPFFNWSLKMSYKENLNKMDWDIVSPKGLKMNGDDPQHTDWVIGMGIKPDSFYKDSILSEHMSTFAFKLFRLFNQLPFIKISGSGIISGNVKFIDSSTDLSSFSKNSIFVIKDSSIDYFPVLNYLSSDGCLIALYGNQASHLAINSSELNVNFIIKSDLDINDNDYVYIDLDKGVFNVM